MTKDVKFDKRDVMRKIKDTYGKRMDSNGDNQGLVEAMQRNRQKYQRENLEKDEMRYQHYVQVTNWLPIHFDQEERSEQSKEDDKNRLPMPKYETSLQHLLTDDLCNQIFPPEQIRIIIDVIMRNMQVQKSFQGKRMGKE